MTVPDFSPDAIRTRFAAFVCVVAVSVAAALFLLVRKFLLRRHAATLAEGARRLPLESLEALFRAFGREGARRLFEAADSPSEFDRAFAALLRDAAARGSFPLADAEKMHGIRIALGHGHEPTFREIESTRDLDPQRMVFLRSRPAIVADVRENGFLVIELGRRRHAIERGRRYRLLVMARNSILHEPHHAEVDILDAATGVALVSHAPLSPESPRTAPGALA